MLKGKICHINSTKYVVRCNDTEYNCVLRGKFRKDKIIPYVGDIVTFDEKTCQILDIHERKNMLNRPNICNIDIAVIMVSVKAPDLDLILLDKLLCEVIIHNISPIICFSKVDLLKNDEEIQFKKIKNYYTKIGIKAFVNTEIKAFENFVAGKTIVICGQTGSGKSTFINKLDPSINIQTSEISKALGRGKHTTRYVSLYMVKDYFVADTPGFSKLDINQYSEEEIRNTFLEFQNYSCKYRNCNHINTEGCEVIKNVNKSILQSRYDNYIRFIKESNENSSKLFSK